MEATFTKYELMIDPNVIIVSVQNPTQVKGTLSSHTIYTVQGSDLTGNFSLSRRYSDFDHVRSIMVKNWPGCYVPPIPRKKAIGNNQFLFIEQRRVGLNNFCQQVALLKHLWYSKQFQVLIRGNADVQKGLKEIQQQTFEQISLKYEQVFKNLYTKTCEQAFIAKVQKFQANIKRISQVITTYKEQSMYIFDSYKNNQQQYEVLLKYIFPEYEKHFLSAYIYDANNAKLIFANPQDSKLSELIQQLKKIADQMKIEEFYRLLQKEDRQIEAFLEVYKSRQTYQTMLKNHQIKDKDLLLQQNKLNAGKQSFFKSIIKSSIEEEKKNIQIAIDLNNERIKGLTFLSDLINIIMAEFEIPRFEQQKVHKYFETIKTMGEFELRMTQIKQKICDCILQNPNIIDLPSQGSV